MNEALRALYFARVDLVWYAVNNIQKFRNPREWPLLDGRLVGWPWAAD